MDLLHLLVPNHARETWHFIRKAGQHILGGIVLVASGAGDDFLGASAEKAESFAKRQMYIERERPAYALQILAELIGAIIVAPGRCDRI